MNTALCFQTNNSLLIIGMTISLALGEAVTLTFKANRLNSTVKVGKKIQSNTSMLVSYKIIDLLRVASI
jgi:hypothetical protein